MGQVPELLTEILYEVVEEGESNVEEDEEFYEKIEAPKFVDLTLPDPYRPDDRFWFCSRVGCDQKHEEEMDPEAIYKNFVLRVMAARSPNIKLRKALNAKNASANAKCPLSAPAKSSKSRVISRLAIVSSIPQKLVIDPKEKVRSIPKLSATPMPKSKQVAAKYMTTPRNKKCLSNQNSFRSVQNPKLTTVSSPKNKIVAKALVFQSPKKVISVKTSVELRTPLTKICEGMKRLKISSQRKGVGNLNKSSKDFRCNVKKTLPLDPSIERVLGRSNKSLKDVKCSNKKVLHVDPSRKQLNDRRIKSVNPQISKQLEAKSLKCTKKSKGKLTQECNSFNGHKEVIENESSDMEVDLKSRISGISSRKNSDALSDDLVRGEMKSAPNFLEENSEGINLPIFPVLEGKENSQSEGLEIKDTKSSESNREERSSEVMDGDDKENALVPHDNRDMSCENVQKRKILGMQEETQERNKKGARIIGKNFKGGALEVKHRKPKPTNPKPFRLRTDERGILREANLERRSHFVAPQREARTVSNSMKNRGNQMKPNDKCFEQSKSNNDVLQGSEKEAQTVLQKIEHKQTKTAALKSLRGHQMIQKTANITPQRSFRSYSKENANQIVRPQGVGSSRKAQLSAIKETSSEPERSKESIKPSNPIKSASARSSSRGRKPVTVATEPKFHNTHVPKSCTRNIISTS